MAENEAPHGLYSLRSSMLIAKDGGATIYNPYANMHDPVEAKVEWLTDNGFEVRGVVHVGANDGKELAWYVTKNYRPILAFEPHPRAFQQLREHYWNHALLWGLALGNREGILDLKVPVDGNTERSSKFDPVPTEGHDWTETPMGEIVHVPLVRFDTWATRGGIDLSPFNTLVIDVQGMELEVLQGFGSRLGNFSFLIVECSKVPMYDGEPPAESVVAWLNEEGFSRMTPIEEHDDVIFVRNDLNPNGESTS